MQLQGCSIHAPSRSFRAVGFVVCSLSDSRWRSQTERYNATTSVALLADKAVDFALIPAGDTLDRFRGADTFVACPIGPCSYDGFQGEEGGEASELIALKVNQATGCCCPSGVEALTKLFQSFS